MYSSTLGVELQLGENMFVEVGSPVWLEFAEKVKSYWCREKRERAAESLNDEQPPRIILPRSKRPALPPADVIAVAAPDGRLSNGGNSTIALAKKRKHDGEDRVVANWLIQLQRKRRAQYQVEQLAQLPDDMRAVVLQRRVQDSKDGVTFGDSMKWARRQVERLKMFEDQRAVNQKYYDLLEAAVRKHRMIELIRVDNVKDHKGKDQRGARKKAKTFGPGGMSRLAQKVFGLLHVYRLLLRGGADCNSYVTLTGAQEEAAVIAVTSRRSIARWQEDFEDNNGLFSPSKMGQHCETWLTQDSIRFDALREWLTVACKQKPTADGTGAYFSIAMLRKYLNEEFMAQFADPNDVRFRPRPADKPEGEPEGVVQNVAGKWNVSESTALRWAHDAGLTYVAQRKSYYVDNHDREDVLRYRDVYVARQRDYELQQFLWVQLTYIIVPIWLFARV